MICKEYPYRRENGVLDPTLVRFYSDKGLKLLNRITGEEFDDAVERYPASIDNYQEIEVISTEEATEHSESNNVM